MIWLVQVGLSSGFLHDQVGAAVFVICSVGFLAVGTLANSVYASFTLCTAGIAPVLLSVMHFRAYFAGREVAASGFDVTKFLAFLALC